MCKHLSPWGALKSPGPAGGREREKAKKGAYGDRKLNPLLYHFTLGRPSGALEHSIQIYVKEFSHTFDLQRSPGCYSLNIH